MIEVPVVVVTRARKEIPVMWHGEKPGAEPMCRVDMVEAALLGSQALSPAKIDVADGWETKERSWWRSAGDPSSHCRKSIQIC
jgi:hypothetical protein